MLHTEIQLVFNNSSENPAAQSADWADAINFVLINQNKEHSSSLIYRILMRIIKRETGSECD